MGIVLKALAVVVILAFVGLVGYAYLGDLRAPQVPVSHPVTLDAQ